MAAVTVQIDFEVQENEIWHCFHIFPICHEVIELDAMTLVLWMLSFRSAFSLSSFTFIKRLCSSSSLSAIKVVSSAYLRLLIFLPAIPSLGIGVKTVLFHSCGHCWDFQISWCTECSTLTASSFRIWNSLAGILSPQLVFFVVMLPKAHLTSHSRMSGSRWVITPSWLSGSLRAFCTVLLCMLATFS